MAWKWTAVLWIVILFVNIPVFMKAIVHEYEYLGMERSVCLFIERRDMLAEDIQVVKAARYSVIPTVQSVVSSFFSFFK